MKVMAFVDTLRAHDVSLAIALLELVRRADEEGSVEHGEWIAAVRASHARLVPSSPSTNGHGATHAEELAQYIDEHVLNRLVAEHIVAPGTETGRVHLMPEVWADVAPDRVAIADYIERRIGELIEGPAGDSASVLVPDGSTLSTTGLVKSYRRRRVVADVDLEVRQGEIVGLLGPNGAGKTTTFYMIVGLISPDSGRVYLDQKELTRVPMYRRARQGIGYLAQEPSVFRKLTVEENILAILETMGLKRAEKKARLEELLDELGLKHLRKARAYSLSGGERRRLEITRALVSRPKFMLLDEPFAGVDPIAVHDIQQIVADLRHRGIGVIITDHNVEQTLDIVDRAYIMYDGRVRVAGTVAELVWNEDVAEIYFGPTLTARMRERYRRPEVQA